MSLAQNTQRWQPPVGITLRKGQQRIFEVIDDTTRHQSRYSIVWPTGYGKTYLVCIAHAVLTNQQRITRTLVIVPQETQFLQYVGMLPDMKTGTPGTPGLLQDLHDLQVPHRGVQGCDESGTLVLRHHRRNTADIFITTIHKLLADPGLFTDLLQTQLWAVIADEGHHYALHNTWGKAIQQLNPAVLISMSATPIRRDRRDTLAPVQPDSYISIQDAVQEEHALRPIRTHTLDYLIDLTLQSADGETQRSFRLSDISAELDGLDVSEWEAKKHVRYHQGYLSQMLCEAVTCFQRKQASQPGQHQMLIFAMSCAHAAHITDAIHGLTQDDTFARWIGVGPSGLDPSVNTAHLRAFQHNEFPCLVQVNKAGEGFNNKRCSVLVFLHTMGDTPQVHQQIGRGLRRNDGIADWRHDVCDIFCSVDAPIADVLATFGILAPQDPDGLDNVFCGPDDQISCGPDNVPRLFLMHDLLLLDVAYLETLIHYPLGSLEATIEASREPLRAQLASEGKDLPADADIARVLKAVLLEAQRPELVLPRARKASLKQQMQGEVSHLARTAMHCLYGPFVDKKQIGMACEVIHTEWVKKTGERQKDMEEPELRAKQQWMKQVNNTIVATREVPSWLRV